MRLLLQLTVDLDAGDRYGWTSPTGERRLMRLPQKDFCQATGVYPDARTKPTAAQAWTASSACWAAARRAQRTGGPFFQAQLLFWMLCATDGHAKNFSLFLRPGGH